MLTSTENEMFTRVGPGTPAGEWLRRYWHPIAISDKWDGIKTLWRCDEEITFRGKQGTVAGLGKQVGNFEGKPTAVRVLGEDLVLFRDGKGKVGLLGLYCPHRRASFEYGRIREDGIECCYHGWKFDVEGNCIAQPAEPEVMKFKHKAYEVREMGGLIWAHMGPGEAPVLPKIEVVAREDGVRALENWGLWPCNYLQIVEQSGDAAHTAALHGGAGGERQDIWSEMPKITWEEHELGMVWRQRRTNYNRGSIYVMPTLARLAQPWPGGKFKWPRYSGLWKTPVDDNHTLMLHVTFTAHVNGRPPELPEGLSFDITEQLNNHRWQDYEALVSQGEIYDRTQEKLGHSDGNIVLMRKMIKDGIEAAQKGKDPKGVWRAPEMDKLIDLTHITADTLTMGTAA